MFKLICKKCKNKKIFINRINSKTPDFPYVICPKCGERQIPEYFKKIASAEYKAPRKYECFFCGWPMGLIGAIIITCGMMLKNTTLVFVGGLLFNLYFMLVLMSFVLWKNVLVNSKTEYDLIKKAMEEEQTSSNEHVH